MDAIIADKWDLIIIAFFFTAFYVWAKTDDD